MLEVNDLRVFYGDFQALFGIDFRIEAGQTVSIIGANGAGKSTFLKTLCGQLRPHSGSILFEGRPIGGWPPSTIAGLGISMVPEGRRLFTSLTVEENILSGGFSRRTGPWTLERVYRLFPALRTHRNALATTLSGGQQQMVAIGRALMANPRVLICDEVSLGLAPAVIKDIYTALPQLLQDGVALILVEQDVNTALSVSDYAYCFMHGRVSLQGRPGTLSKAEISDAYFGIQ
ncbi:ABC transporter ATP-binding protein [Pusillimonas caeni]|uniref:ABC transporter ATP-binding protein n=1 Tax=Pusillimonas caeni TaxID=1348472 RepID=UPI000E5A0AF0|nr:ABC transporter ATP-binding protein [Pusillimonas caeni]TFL14948.1 ABC transporter ATP-binding protein [Pusillimonas caeni]